MRSQRVIRSAMAAGLFLGLVLSACVGNPPAEPTEAPTKAPTEEPTVGPKDYGVPAEDAAVANPFEVDEASVERGEEVYQGSCVDCHGPEGRGDGPAAGRLNPPPADFRAGDVMELSDGELFYIISNGSEGSAMTAWAFFDEETRWHLVNYIRSLQQ